MGLNKEQLRILKEGKEITEDHPYINGIHVSIYKIGEHHAIHFDNIGNSNAPKETVFYLAQHQLKAFLDVEFCPYSTGAYAVELIEIYDNFFVQKFEDDFEVPYFY